MPGRDQRATDFQRTAFDAAAIERRQQLHDAQTPHQARLNP
jgi:hypothetical protein